MTTSRTEGFRTLQVVETWQLTPRMKRLRLTGEDLDHFASTDDIHVRLYIPESRQTDIRSLVFHADGQPRDSGPGSGFAVRYYTIRRIDASAGWLDIDFVLHDAPGPGSDFARCAQPGDICGVSGPCGLSVKPASRYLLVGGETALPAIARIVEELPRHSTAHVFVEIADADERIDLDMPAGMSLTWLHRQGKPSLAQAAKAVIGDYDPAEQDDFFIWIAGEFGAIASLRLALHPFAKARYMCVPYWLKKYETARAG